MAVLHKMAYGSAWILVVDADPSGSITAPAGTFAVLSSGGGSAWLNSDGTTTWVAVSTGSGGLNVGYGLLDEVDAADWTSLPDLLTGESANVVAPQVAIHRVGPSAAPGLIWTPHDWNAGARASGYGQAVAAGEWTLALAADVSWNRYPASSTLVSCNLIFGFCDDAGANCRGTYIQCQSRTLLGDSTGGIRQLLMANNTLGVGALPTAWSYYLGYGFESATPMVFIIQRQADNTFRMRWGLRGQGILFDTNSVASPLPAQAGAGNIFLATETNGIDSAGFPPPSWIIRTPLTSLAGFPDEVEL